MVSYVCHAANLVTSISYTLLVSLQRTQPSVRLQDQTSKAIDNLMNARICSNPKKAAVHDGTAAERIQDQAGLKQARRTENGLRAGPDESEQSEEVAEADLAIGAHCAEVIGNVAIAAGTARARANESEQSEEVAEADLTIGAE